MTEERRLRDCLEAGARWMTWLSARTDDVCAQCREADGKIVAAEEMDVAAHEAACLNPNGCRCVCGPVSDEEASDYFNQLTNS